MLRGEHDVSILSFFLFGCAQRCHTDLNFFPWVPRRLVMILKLNDLTRSLDQSLATTHGSSRVFVIVARYCSLAVWRDDLRLFKERYAREGLNMRLAEAFLSSWLQFQWFYSGLRIVEWGMDARARLIKMGLFLEGFYKKGWSGAVDLSAGLSV